ncbi:hypothetical protein ABBQ38_011623 [Trebouxia sp. C0009 RCD-2024]
MPPRRTRPLKSLKGRVQKLLTRAELEKSLSKSNKRLVVVHYFTSSSPVQQTQSVRALLIKVSRQRELSNVLFVEIDVSQPEFEGIAADNGVTTLPAFQLWEHHTVVETLTGMALGSVASKCIDHAGSSSADPSSRWKRLLMGVLVLGAVGAAGLFGYRHQQSGQNNRSPAAQLADVDVKIQEAKTRLAYVTRRKLHKAKREQQKKLKSLEARRQGIVASQKAHRKQVVQRAAIKDSDSDGSDSDSD